MSKLRLELVGLDDMAGQITINNKFVKIRRDKKSGYYCSIETTEPRSEVAIYKNHHYHGKAWFWWNLLFFFVSFFGIFDFGYNRKCLVYDSRFYVSTEQDATVIVKRQNYVDGNLFVDIQSDAEIEQIANKQYCDKDAKKKHSIMTKSKIGIAVGILVTTVVLLAVFLF